MGRMKQFLEDVASDMGESDISKPEVVAEAQRRLNEKEAIMAGCNGNGNITCPECGANAGFYISRNLHVVFRDGKWRKDELEGCQPNTPQCAVCYEELDDEVVEGALRSVDLEMRLASVEARAYGVRKSALAILETLTDEEIRGTLDDVLESLLQEGREISQ